ncbi:MAG: radical SAM protein, partial [Nanoarchaeota archaeon]|nr:radical SAM protein [Nanoarchaeota archaeon]
MIQKHIPGRLQISTECNQECLFCSVPAGPPENPAFEEIKKRIDKLKKLGTNDLFITGGEPMIHKDIFKILDYAKKVGFYEITIQSNASELTRPILEKIKAYGNVKFNISFHSFEEGTCNKLSGAEHYQKFMTAMKHIRDLGIPLFLTIVITKMNYMKLTDHIKFIRKNFPNITHFSFNFVDPSGRARDNSWIVPTLFETQRYI